jgi:hypothetical protein
MRKTCLLLTLYAALAIGEPARAEALTGDQIMEKANAASYYAGRDGRADVKMIMSDAGGGTREREFTILRLNEEGGDQKFYVYFREPADVRKMAYLVWKHVDSDDDRWLWLPALNLVKRIAPGDKRTSFVGSDFFYEDVSGRSLKEDTHELVDETDTQYVVRNTPVSPGSVEFATYVVWIDKDTFLPRKAEYYDANGNVYRRLAATKVERIAGHPTATEQVAEDLAAGSRTRNVFSNVEYDIGLNGRIFTERFLRRPPREVSR